MRSQGYIVHVIGRSLNIQVEPEETYHSIIEYSYKQLTELFKDVGSSVVIDLAYTSVPNTSYEDPIKDFSENLYNVIKHLDFAVAINTHKFVYVSSGGTVYGEIGNTPFSEQDHNFPLSPYGIT